jgi:hypothetical protein
MELYLHSSIHFHGVVFSEARGIYLCYFLYWDVDTGRKVTTAMSLRHFTDVPSVGYYASNNI